MRVKREYNDAHTKSLGLLSGSRMHFRLSLQFLGSYTWIGLSLPGQNGTRFKLFAVCVATDVDVSGSLLTHCIILS